MTVSIGRATARTPDPIVVLTIDKSAFEKNKHMWFTRAVAAALMRQIGDVLIKNFENNP